jgi:hypothetical protein
MSGEKEVIMQVRVGLGIALAVAFSCLGGCATSGEGYSNERAREFWRDQELTVKPSK